MIKAENLTKIFGEKKALDSVSFEIDDGSIYGLVGSNGSGKSTLLCLISGVYRPDGGRIGVDGIDSFNNPTVKSQISFLGDTPYFLPQSNLEEMARFYSSMYPKFDRDMYKYLLSVFPLNPKARLSSFSKGMQRQAALMLSLSSLPRYILLDEAFDGLDVVMRRVLANLLIEGVEKRGITAIISSHNLRELEDMCDRLGILHNGKILLNGDMENLRLNMHKVQVAFSGVPEMSVFSKLDVIKIEHTGSLISLVVKGDEEEIMNYIKSLSPVFAECIEPTLEEMFVYELEATGYDVKNILS